MRCSSRGSTCRRHPTDHSYPTGPPKKDFRMRTILLMIPHEIAGIPVFGFGWLLVLLAVGLAARLFVVSRGKQTFGGWLASESLMWAMVAVVIVFVLPVVELKNVDGDPAGMAIRGYGVMLVVAVVASVALAAHRARSRGIDPEWIYSLAFPWVLVGGIVGARMFYVIQYRHTFVGDGLADTLLNMLKFTEGGLVVYGSFIGGVAAAIVFMFRNGLSIGKMGDVIVPCMFLGLCLGRIGCLMNGCCYGGKCEEHWTSIRFPPGSLVYKEQMFDGTLLGLEIDPASRRILRVQPGSLADQADIKPGQTLQQVSLDDRTLKDAPRDIPAEYVRLGVVALVDDQIHRWSPEQLPGRAMPVRPTQVISSLAALGLCLLLCGLSVYQFREGTIMLLGFASYAILRFILEMVRVDEQGQFGTSLSISQWVSILVLAGSFVGLAWLYTRPRDDSRLHPTTS